MSEILRYYGDYAKGLADHYFDEIATAEGSDWIVTHPSGPRFFRLREPKSDSVKYSWTALEEWKWYEKVLPILVYGTVMGFAIGLVLGILLSWPGE